MVFVHQGSEAQGAEYFSVFGDAVRAIADPEGRLYASFGVERGGMRAMFGLSAWRRGIEAFLNGHFIGRKVGDPWTLPTVLAVHGDEILWEHRGRHAGDHPDVYSIPFLVD